MQITISANGQQLCLHTKLTMHSPPRHSPGDIRFHAIWLRDNAQDASTRDAGNGQRLIALRDIPADTYINQADIIGDDRLRIHLLPEDITINYSITWLIQHRYDKPAPADIGWVNDKIQLWRAKDEAKLPCAKFDDVQQPDKQQQWLADVVHYGFGKLTHGPIADGALYQVIDLFGYVRETNYGRHFEVRVEEKPSNLAFTGAGIQAHTDNPYRDPVPTIQLLYCLESSAQGGDNMVVDGFAAAQRLRDETPDYFDLLSRYCARFEFAGEAGVCLQTRKPMIELAADGELIGVRFNNRSAAAITDVPFSKMADYYAAYRRFGNILDDPAMAVSFRLNPGDCFIVDNTRVMHARKAFSGAGTRWLQGCYADKDALLSKVAAQQNQALHSAHIDASNIVDHLETIFLCRGGEEYLGEKVTMAQHMLQGATLAVQNKQSDTIVAAVLLHDIGHFIGELGTFSIQDTEDRYHEVAGADMLAKFFPDAVVQCVRHHVAAKRYLCATKKTYFNNLSAASVHSLKLQGGPMNTQEVADFASNPYLNDIIQVRYLDDAGKDPTMQTYDFAYFKPLLQRLVDQHTCKL